MNFLAIISWQEIGHIFINFIKGLLLNVVIGIFSLVSFLFDILIKITQVDLMDTSEIYQRVIMIFTVVITFYITFEFVKYTVSPENITDKQKGAMPLFARIVIAILLLAFTPKIFTTAMTLQERVINTQVLPKVILGAPAVGEGEDLASSGRVFASNLFSVFYRFDNAKCLSDGNNNKTCLETKEEVEEVVRNVSSTENILHTLFAGPLFSDEFWTGLKSGVEFNPLFAILFGGFLLYVIFMYCKDVALRYVQLVFLQIISPIAILSYIAPNKEGMFKKWLKQCTTTYLDIFIRLALLYFMMLVMKQFLGHDLTRDGMNAGLFVKLFIIFALLRFVLKVPKLLQELFPNSGAASIGFGLSAKDRKGVLGQAWSGGKKVVARTAGAIAGGKRSWTGRKGLIGDDNLNKKGKDRKLRRYATYANAMIRSGYEGYNAGKDGSVHNAVRAGQEKAQSYETIVANQGTVLGHDYRPGYYQDKKAEIQVKLDLLKQMSDAKGAATSAIGEIKFRKQMDSIGASLQASGNTTAKVAWDKEIKNYEKLARRYASGDITATEYTKLVTKMITDFDTKHSTKIADNFMDSSKRIDVTGALDTGNKAVYETIATRMQEARTIAKEISSDKHNITYITDVVQRDHAGNPIIDPATGEPKTVREAVRMPKMNDKGEILDEKGFVVKIKDYDVTTGTIIDRPQTFADYLGDFTDAATAAKVQMEASEETKRIQTNSEGKK